MSKKVQENAKATSSKGKTTSEKESKNVKANTQKEKEVKGKAPAKEEVKGKAPAKEETKGKKAPQVEEEDDLPKFTAKFAREGIEEAFFVFDIDSIKEEFTVVEGKGKNKTETVNDQAVLNVGASSILIGVATLATAEVFRAKFPKGLEDNVEEHKEALTQLYADLKAEYPTQMAQFELYYGNFLSLVLDEVEVDEDDETVGDITVLFGSGNVVVADSDDEDEEEADEEDEESDDDDSDDEEGVDIDEVLEGMEIEDLKKLAKACEVKVGKKDDEEAIIEKIKEEADEEAIVEALMDMGIIDVVDEESDDDDSDDEEESEEEADEDDEEEIDLEAMSLKELKAFADENEVEYGKKVTKEELIALIEEALGEEETDEEDEADEEEEESETPDYDSMSLKELKEMADERGIEYDKKAKKSDLIAALVEDDTSEDSVEEDSSEYDETLDEEFEDEIITEDDEEEEQPKKGKGKGKGKKK